MGDIMRWDDESRATLMAAVEKHAPYREVYRDNHDTDAWWEMVARSTGLPITGAAACRQEQNVRLGKVRRDVPADALPEEPVVRPKQPVVTTKPAELALEPSPQPSQLDRIEAMLGRLCRHLGVPR